MDNFEEKQSKYGKIYKVAGPRKYTLNTDPFAYLTRFMSAECEKMDYL